MSFIRAHVLGSNGNHLEFDVEVAAALVRDDDLKGLVESNSDGSKVKALRVDLHLAITATSDDVDFLANGRYTSDCSGNVVTSRSQAESRTWVVETNEILCFVELVSCENGNAHVILFFLEGGYC